jgi:hypothetical protein
LQRLKVLDPVYPILPKSGRVYLRARDSDVSNERQLQLELLGDDLEAVRADLATARRTASKIRRTMTVSVSLTTAIVYLRPEGYVFVPA